MSIEHFGSPSWDEGEPEEEDEEELPALQHFAKESFVLRNGYTEWLARCKEGSASPEEIQEEREFWYTEAILLAENLSDVIDSEDFTEEELKELEYHGIQILNVANRLASPSNLHIMIDGLYGAVGRN